MTAAPTPLPHRQSPHSRPALIVVLAVALVVSVVLLVQHDVFEDSSSSGTRGSGISVTQARAVAPFDGVELAGSTVVTIRVGAPQSVVVRADHNLLERVTTEASAGSLVVGTTGSFTTKSPMSVDVTTPSLESLTLSGSGIVAAEGVDAARLSVSLPGSGVVRAAGRVDRLDVSLTGSGDAQLEQLIARDARATVGGSGRIVVHATETLDAGVAGSGAIVYTGSPRRVTKSITGSGAVIGQ